MLHGLVRILLLIGNSLQVFLSGRNKERNDQTLFAERQKEEKWKSLAKRQKKMTWNLTIDRQTDKGMK